jgi:hypothetical protein
MAQVQITQLPAAGAITGSELVPIVQNGVTVRTTTGAISASPSQTQTFLTLNQEPSLPNSRRLSSGTGVGLTDGGAQAALTITLNGASGSLEVAGNGVIVKTASNAVISRTLTATGAGFGITNGDGVSGNPTFGLTGLALALANMGGTGMLAVVGGTTIAGRQIYGTANQITVVAGNGSNDPTISITDNPVIPGTAAMTIPSGTSAQQPVGASGQMRFNSDTQTFDGYSAGSWRQFSLAGGVISFGAGSTGLTPAAQTSGVITLGGTLNASSGGTGATTLTGYVKGNGTLAMTASAAIPTTDLSGTISNAQLANSAITINGSNVSLGGSVTITAAVPNSLTIGAGLSGGSYNGSTAVTVAIDSTVATLNDAQTFTNKSISGATNTLSNIPNSSLNNSSVSFNGVSVTLGASGTLTASTASALTIGTGLQGTSFNGSTPVTIAIDSTVATLTGTQTLTGKTINASSNTLSNIPNSSLTNSSVTIGTTAISLGASSLTLGGLTSVAVTQDPVSALQLATKQYVDSVAEGLHVHASCAAATTGTLASITGGTVTYNNGTAGVGATLTLSNALTVLDGYTLLNGDRVLVKNEATQANNGIYTWATGGTVLTRATDFDTAIEIASGDFTFVANGTLYANTGWVQTQPVTTIGSDAIIWQQFSGAGTYTAGTGLTLSGNQFSITNTGVTAAAYGAADKTLTATVNAQGQLTILADTAIAINGNQITSGTVGSAYISGSYTGITGVGTLTAGTWTASTISTAYGGTGLTSYTAGDLPYYSTGSALSKLGIGASTYLLTSTGSAPTWTDPVSVTVGNATNAANVAVTAASTNASYYPAFVSATTGNLGINVDADLTYNPSTNTLTAGTVTATTGIFGGTF